MILTCNRLTNKTNFYLKKISFGYFENCVNFLSQNISSKYFYLIFRFYIFYFLRQPDTVENKRILKLKYFSLSCFQTEPYKFKCVCVSWKIVFG